MSMCHPVIHNHCCILSFPMMAKKRRRTTTTCDSGPLAGMALTRDPRSHRHHHKLQWNKFLIEWRSLSTRAPAAFSEVRMAVDKRYQASGEAPNIRGNFNTPFQLRASSRMALRHIWIIGWQLHWISVCWMPLWRWKESFHTILTSRKIDP